MAGRAEIREIIIGAAEGAGGGAAALRDADFAARLEDFDVEVSFDGSTESGGLSVSVRFTIAANGIARDHRVVA